MLLIPHGLELVLNDNSILNVQDVVHRGYFFPRTFINAKGILHEGMVAIPGSVTQTPRPDTTSHGPVDATASCTSSRQSHRLLKFKISIKVTSQALGRSRPKVSSFSIEVANNQPSSQMSWSTKTLVSAKLVALP